MGLLTRVRDLVRLVLKGHAGKVWRAVTYRFYSNSGSVGLRRDLFAPFSPPPAKLPVKVRPLEPGDDLSWIDAHRPGLSDDQVFERLGQVRMLQSGLRTCHLALDPDGKPCYMQWLILPTENHQVRAFFGNLYPPLAPDEALLEGAYTAEPYRKQGIMGSAMAQIAERARDCGVRWAVAFVDERHEPALKACQRAGFVPYAHRHETFRLFRRHVSFTPLTR